MIIFCIPQLFLSLLNILIDPSQPIDIYNSKDSDILISVTSIECKHNYTLSYYFINYRIIQLIIHQVLLFLLVIINVIVLKVDCKDNEKDKILSYFVVYHIFFKLYLYYLINILCYFTVLPSIELFNNDNDLDIIVWGLGMNLVVFIGPLTIFIPKFILIYFDKEYNPNSTLTNTKIRCYNVKYLFFIKYVILILLLM